MVLEQVVLMKTLWPERDVVKHNSPDIIGSGPLASRLTRCHLDK